jgi:hypothetical protein
MFRQLPSSGFNFAQLKLVEWMWYGGQMVRSYYRFFKHDWVVYLILSLNQKRFYFFGAVIIYTDSWASWLGSVIFDGKICVLLESLSRCFSSSFYVAGLIWAPISGLFMLSSWVYSGFYLSVIIPIVFSITD